MQNEKTVAIRLKVPASIHAQVRQRSFQDRAAGKDNTIRDEYLSVIQSGLTK